MPDAGLGAATTVLAPRVDDPLGAVLEALDHSITAPPDLPEESGSLACY